MTYIQSCKVPVTKKLGGKKTVVRNISYSLKYLELGQAGHWWVNYLYLAGARNGNGDRLSFWAPPQGVRPGLRRLGTEGGELEESGHRSNLGEKGKAGWLASPSRVFLYCAFSGLRFPFKKMTRHMHQALIQVLYMLTSLNSLTFLGLLTSFYNWGEAKRLAQGHREGKRQN